MAGGLALASTIVALVILLIAAKPIHAGVEGVDDRGDRPSVPARGAEPEAITPTLPMDTFLPPNPPPAREIRRIPPVPDWVVELQRAGERAADAGLITKRATTAETAQSAGDSTMFNGDLITYTLVIANDSNSDLTSILVLDVLPQDTLDSKSIRCDSCQKISVEHEIPEPLGGTIVITTITQLNWSINQIAAHQTMQLEFLGRVMGQPDGTLFRNRAFISYVQDGTPKSASSNETRTTVYVRIAEKGKASLSSAPTWFSSDAGGTLSQDWADFDRDGDLDLVLGSSLGATVYRNDQGRLSRFWDSNSLTYGIRWADVITANDQIELVAVGKTQDPPAWWAGQNYVYGYDATEDLFKEALAFDSDYQLLRIAPGDYDRNGTIDLVASTNAIHPALPVRLYKNLGTFAFATGLSAAASANMAAGDADNDDDLDLALGAFPNTTELLTNVSGTLTNSMSIDSSNLFLPYDFSWGDYDGDGWLDLAAAFPLERKVRIYHNEAGKGFKPCCKDIRTRSFYTPLSIDWGDFDGDGQLDLAVADTPPKIWTYSAASREFSTILALAPGSVTGRVWQVRGVDQDNDGDLDLVLANQRAPSQIFTAFAPFLAPAMTQIPNTQASGTAGVDTSGAAAGAGPSASSVAWGDADHDGDLDLLFGAGPPGAPGAFGSKLYYNKKGVFSTKPTEFAGFGPQGVAFGDVDGDHDLDIAVASSGVDEVYSLENTAWPAWNSDVVYPSHSLAWGDADDDGDLDLLVGNTGPNVLYINQGNKLSSMPFWTSRETGDDTRSVAWGDYNNDRYLDFAVGNYEQPSRIYCNNGDNTFTLVWSSVYVSATTSIAWADYDGDGDLDLTVGNDGERNVIYNNQTCQTYTCGKLPFAKRACSYPDSVVSSSPIWSSEETSKTTSLAWGDWDNDNDLDLAVGNYGEHDQVYGNLNSTAGSSRLAWLWSSAEAYKTTGVAWGDPDGDGDLDLAISQGGDGSNGIYRNSYVSPSHLTDDFARTMPLPDNPSYLSIERPGATDDSYFFSSPDLLSGPTHPTVTIHYRLFDPDGTRDVSGAGHLNAAGDPIAQASYEFSLDGGGTWYPATEATGTGGGVLTTARLGNPATFEWDAQADQAISDDARFRICIVPEKPLGLVQHASTCATSPPFRVRGLTCEWPANPVIMVSYPDSAQYEPGSPVQFQGGVTAGSDLLYFIWDFGDGHTDEGQVIRHTYAGWGPYKVTLTVKGAPCPITREVRATTIVGRWGLYLPLVVRNPAAGASAASDNPGP